MEGFIAKKYLFDITKNHQLNSALSHPSSAHQKLNNIHMYLWLFVRKNT